MLYHHLDLSQVPPNKRSKVVDQKAGRLSPFPQTGYHAIEEDGQIMLWLWDKRLQDAAILEARKDYSALDDHISSLKIIPEPVLRQRSSEGGVQLKCVAGVDEQQWRGNVLVASNWSATNEDSDSTTFVEAWDLRSGGLSLVRETLLWRVGLLLLALAMVYQVGVSVGYLTLSSSLTSQLKENREAAATLARVRGEVGRLRSQNMHLLDATGRHDQLIVLAEFDGLIPESASISEWRFQGQVLTVQLEDEELMRTFNCGIGLVMVFDCEKFEDTRNILESEGIPFALIGKVIKKEVEPVIYRGKLNL